MGVNLFMKRQAILKCCNQRNLINSFTYNKKPPGETDFGIKKYRRMYKRCKYCDHMFSFFNFNLKNLYLKKYSTDAYGDSRTIYRNFKKIISLSPKKSDNKNRVKRCSRYLNKKSKILDIGCGLGVFLYELKKKGHKTYGIEPDFNLFNHSKKMLGNNIFNGSFQSYINKKDKFSFDFVSLNKVLEHVTDPKKITNHLSRVMKKGAYIYIEVPDVISSKISKNREELMVEHLHVFSKISLANMMMQSGFNLVEINQIIEPSGKFTIYGIFRK